MRKRVKAVTERERKMNDKVNRRGSPSLGQDSS